MEADRVGTDDVAGGPRGAANLDGATGDGPYSAGVEAGVVEAGGGGGAGEGAMEEGTGGAKREWSVLESLTTADLASTEVPRPAAASVWTGLARPGPLRTDGV